MEFQKIYEEAKTWTIEAGERLVQSLHQTLQVNYKTSAADLVTEKDQEIESFFIDKIKATYPDHFVLGEEGMSTEQSFNPYGETVWIIDPIDGTTNFVHQKRNFCISVALYHLGKPVIGLVYDPIENELFHALTNHGAYLNNEKLKKLDGGSIEEGVISFNHLWLSPNEKVNHEKLQDLVLNLRGVRYVGSAALEMAHVASGRLDAYIDFRLSPWDIAASLVILKEVGAKITTFENQAIDVFDKSSTFVSKPHLHNEIIEFFTKKDLGKCD